MYFGVGCDCVWNLCDECVLFCVGCVVGDVEVVIYVWMCVVVWCG